jgi:hypothetical protein
MVADRGRVIALEALEHLEWQRDLEPTPATELALHPHLAAHAIHEVLHDGETQARPAFAPRPGLLERREDARHVGGRDADARVDHRGGHPRAGLVPAHVQLDRALLGELDRVRDEVREDLPDSKHIALERDRHVAAHVHPELDALGCGGGAEEQGDVAREIAEREGARLEAEDPTLERLEVEHVVHEEAQRLGARAHVANDLALRGVEARGLEHRREPHEASERRAQLVAHDRVEVRAVLRGRALRRAGGLELAREGLGALGTLVRAGTLAAEHSAVLHDPRDRDRHGGERGRTDRQALSDRALLVDDERDHERRAQHHPRRARAAAARLRGGEQAGQTQREERGREASRVPCGGDRGEQAGHHGVETIGRDHDERGQERRACLERCDEEERQHRCERPHGGRGAEDHTLGHEHGRPRPLEHELGGAVAVGLATLRHARSRIDRRACGLEREPRRALKLARRSPP